MSSPTFQLISFCLIACYVQLLLSKGSGLAEAVVAAITVAIGARAAAAPARATS